MDIVSNTQPATASGEDRMTDVARRNRLGKLATTVPDQGNQEYRGNAQRHVESGSGRAGYINMACDGVCRTYTLPSQRRNARVVEGSMGEAVGAHDYPVLQG